MMRKRDKNLYRRLYRMMQRIRICEESFVDPILTGDIVCPVHLCSGQEAVAAGVCSALKKTDYIMGGHRSHGHYIAKGAPLRDLVAEVFCRETGCSKGRGGSMHLVAPEYGVLGTAPIVAGTISLALGAALASAVRKDKKVAVSFFGDGATGEGVLYEAMNFASLRRLPIVFVCENNLYSTHLSIKECRWKNEINDTAAPFGVESVSVDGNDVMAVYTAAEKAVAGCRKGNGPVFIEAMTYRMRGHVGPDDNVQGTHTDIRPEREIAKWRRKDPIKVFERYLESKAVFCRKDFDLIERQVEREIKDAFAYARQSLSPSPRELGKYVFQ